MRATQTLCLVTAKMLSTGVFLGLLLVITLAPVPYGSADVWSETLFQSLVFILGGAWALHALLAGSANFREYALLAPVCALILFALVQTIPFGSSDLGLSSGVTWHAISADPFETWRFAIKLSSLALLGALLFAFTTTRRRLSALVHCVMLVGVGSAVFGILRQASETAGIAFIPTSLRIGQGYAQFVNSNHFAFLMEMALGLIMGVVLGGGVRRDRILIYVAAAIPMWTALALSTSRGGILAILSEVVLFALIVTSLMYRLDSRQKSNGIKAWAWRTSRSVAVRSIIIAVLLLSMAASIVWIGGSPLAHRLDTIEQETGEAGAGAVRRIDIWRDTWQLIIAHPIAGIGFGAYWIAITPYHNASGERTPREAHNDYLELLASGGIIGFAIFAVFLLTLLRRIGVQLRQPDPVRRAMCLGAVAGLFGIAVHSLVDFGLHLTSISAVCVALMVIATTSIIDETGSPRGSMQLRRALIEKSKLLKRGARMLKGWS